MAVTKVWRLTKQKNGKRGNTSWALQWDLVPNALKTELSWSITLFHKLARNGKNDLICHRLKRLITHLSPPTLILALKYSYVPKGLSHLFFLLMSVSPYSLNVELCVSQYSMEKRKKNEQLLLFKLCVLRKEQKWKNIATNITISRYRCSCEMTELLQEGKSEPGPQDSQSLVGLKMCKLKKKLFWHSWNSSFELHVKYN